MKDGCGLPARSRTRIRKEGLSDREGLVKMNTKLSLNEKLAIFAGCDESNPPDFCNSMDSCIKYLVPSIGKYILWTLEKLHTGQYVVRCVGQPFLSFEDKTPSLAFCHWLEHLFGLDTSNDVYLTVKSHRAIGGPHPWNQKE